MDEWHIKHSLLNSIYLSLYSKWPFSKMKHNIRTKESMEFESEYSDSLCIPNGDSIAHRTVVISQIIPIESIQIFSDMYKRMVATYCKKDQFIDRYRYSIDEYFGHISLWPGSWYNFGYKILQDQTVFNDFTCYAYRIAESFIQITFNFNISDNQKYKLYLIVNAKYKRSILLIKMRHPILLRSQSMYIFSPIHILHDKLYDYFSDIRNDCIDFLKRNKLLYHISDHASISLFSILSFRKYSDYLKIKYETIWDSFDVDSKYSFKDSDDFIFPETLNYETDLSLLTKIILVNEETHKIPDCFQYLENELHSTLRDWGNGLVNVVTINNTIHTYYRKISQFRNNYYSKNKMLRLSKRYQTFLLSNYWVNLIANEYIKKEKKPGMKLYPIMERDRFNKKENLVENINKRNILEIKALNELSRFIERSLKEYYNIKVVSTNKKTQRLIIVLTIVTVIIGIIQICSNKESLYLINKVYILFIGLF